MLAISVATTDAALAAAAVKAKVLADQEEWEILRLTAFVVDSQVMNYQYDSFVFNSPPSS